MGTCSEVSVQAAQIGCLDADFRQHVRPADIELRVIPSRSSGREAGRVSSDSSHPGARRPRFLARLAAMTAVDPHARQNGSNAWRMRRGSLPRCTRTRTRMTLAEPRAAGAHTRNEDGLT